MIERCWRNHLESPVGINSNRTSEVIVWRNKFSKWQPRPPLLCPGSDVSVARPRMSQNYKETLNLPRTDFPMKANLTQREPELLKLWEETRVYEQILKAREDRPLFVLHDGPPFANGDVHMGTALNKILKDFVVKSQSMLGKRAPYIPGWDCHGLPIEYKVVKESRGLSPLDVRKKSEAFARKYIDLQRAQFKRLGVLGDWENPYLTMDPKYEAVILRVFAAFVEKDLVYQSKKPVFWSTGAQTALAEAEVEYQERDDISVYVRFPITSGDLAGKASIAIWTTTPWTLPANLAIAVDPDELYVVQNFSRDGVSETLLLADKLVPQFCANTKFDPTGEPVRSLPGRELDKVTARHPFLERDAIVFAADFVTMDSGTGAVHIAPGHGADDYMLGTKNKLPILSPVDDHGRFTEEADLPDLIGKYVFDANADIVALLRAKGTLLGEQRYHHSYPYCWRSKTPVIFRAVEQFFIRIDALRDKALKAIHQEVKWIPSWGENRIAGTVESRPDWVISRQRSWGVPLPVFYSADGKAILDANYIRKLADLVAEHGSNIWFELSDADMAQKLGLPEGTTKRNDTIDVWIDSGVSHEAVVKERLGVDQADMYLEATDQHRGWFQSSLMTSVALYDRAPYKTCVTHGFVVDVDGKKISKSSSYDKPMDAGYFVAKHGADLVRLWASSIDYTDDVPFSEEIFTRLGDTYRRVRNTLRILLGNLHDEQLEGAAPSAPGQKGRDGAHPSSTLIDRWILERLGGVIAECRAAYESHEFHKVYHTLNQFCAVDLSSLYIDITKDRMYCDAADSPRRRATQQSMREVFDALCLLLAPILAFTADEAWKHSNAKASVHLQEFPVLSNRGDESSAMVTDLLRLRAIVGQAIERARQEKLIGNALEAAVILRSNSDVTTKIGREELEEFFILSDLTIEQGDEASAVVSKTSFARCARCWRHRAAVGQSAKHPELCDRCEEVVTSLQPLEGSATANR
ncbi:MAG: isoleucyl-tRNA synthetase [Verrucomicrobiota bacterium]